MKVKIRSEASKNQLEALDVILTKANYEDLRKSGLSDETIIQHGIRSLAASEARVILKRKTEVGTGYVIPYTNKGGGFMDGVVNFRLDKPLPSPDMGKKPRKYIRPVGSNARLYIPFPTWKILDDIIIPLIITEGEKKVLKATQEGFYSIGISGVWNWSSQKMPIADFNSLKIKNRTFYVVFDGDKETNFNVKLAQNRLAKMLVKKGAQVKIVDLPPREKLDDYLVRYGNKAFQVLLETATSFELSSKPTIEVREGELKNQTDQSWKIIMAENQKVPFMFIYGNWPVRVELDKKEDGRPIIRQITEARLRHHLIRIADWIRKNKKGFEVPVIPSKTLLQDFLATPNMDLPYLEGIVESPVFAADGTLEINPGYSRKTMLLYLPKKGFEIPTVSDNPTEEDLRKAKSLIIDHLLVDFPFTGGAERAHAIALLLLPFVRKLINSPTPLHLIEKSTVGTGATLLARCIAWICTGHDYTSLPEGRDGEEWRKRVTAVLQNAIQFLVIDNLSQQLDSSALASALTSTFWEDRILGKTEHKGVPIRCAWVATGNNPILSRELARRTIRIRMDAKVEHPHLRDPKNFKHPELLDWAKQNRAELVWAGCVLVKRWVRKGMPRGAKSLGMFESWAQVIGGILETAGISGFLGNLIDFYENVNVEEESKKAFIAAWLEEYKEEPKRTSDLFKTATSDEVLLPLGDSKNPKGQMTRLGLEIKKMQGQVFTIDSGNGVIKTVVVEKSKGKIKNCTSWRLSVKSTKVLPVVKGLKIKVKKPIVKKNEDFKRLFLSSKQPNVPRS